MWMHTRPWRSEIVLSSYLLTELKPSRLHCVLMRRIDLTTHFHQCQRLDIKMLSGHTDDNNSPREIEGERERAREMLSAALTVCYWCLVSLSPDWLQIRTMAISSTISSSNPPPPPFSLSTSTPPTPSLRHVLHIMHSVIRPNIFISILTRSRCLSLFSGSEPLRGWIKSLLFSQPSANQLQASAAVSSKTGGSWIVSGRYWGESCRTAQFCLVQFCFEGNVQVPPPPQSFWTPGSDPRRRSQQEHKSWSQTSEGAGPLTATPPPVPPAAGKYGDSSKSVFVQPLDKYPVSRLGRAEETALGSEMILGGSVLLGSAFINVPINFTCPALFCFH